LAPHKHKDDLTATTDTNLPCGVLPRQKVQRAQHAARAALQNVGVDHRRRDVLMAEQLLDGSDVAARLKQVCRERVPQRVASDALA